MIEHIVWDWNGTLFGDSRALIDATIDAFARCGFPPVTRAAYQRHHVQPITTFYERLAARQLSDEERQRLDGCFRAAYERHRQSVDLTADAVDALSRWTAAGRRQSLLSMYPHEGLMPLVDGAGIAHHFTRVDGTTGHDLAREQVAAVGVPVVATLTAAVDLIVDGRLSIGVPTRGGGSGDGVSSR